MPHINLVVFNQILFLIISSKRFYSSKSFGSEGNTRGFCLEGSIKAYLKTFSPLLVNLLYFSHLRNPQSSVDSIHKSVGFILSTIARRTAASISKQSDLILHAALDEIAFFFFFLPFLIDKGEKQSFLTFEVIRCVRKF